MHQLLLNWRLFLLFVAIAVTIGACDNPCQSYTEEIKTRASKEIYAELISCGAGTNTYVLHLRETSGGSDTVILKTTASSINYDWGDDHHVIAKIDQIADVWDISRVNQGIYLTVIRE